MFQLLLSLCYLAFGILVYPSIKRYGNTLSLGFISFRITAVCLSIIGTVVLLSLLNLSEIYVQNGSQPTLHAKVLGSVMKNTRDALNHVFMVVMLCIGNIMLYMLLTKTVLVPHWISIWGICSAILSVIASLLVLFRFLDIVTPEYLVLNAPTGILEILFGGWLMTKGFKERSNLSR